MGDLNKGLGKEGVVLEGEVVVVNVLLVLIVVLSVGGGLETGSWEGGGGRRG